MTANTVSSRKQKARNLQKYVADKLLSIYTCLTKDDIKSTPMGCGGSDIWLSQSAKSFFPYDVECKNVEKLNVWDAWDQVQGRIKDLIPLVIIKKNHRKPLAVIDLDEFIRLQRYEKYVRS